MERILRRYFACRETGRRETNGKDDSEAIFNRYPKTPQNKGGQPSNRLGVGFQPRGLGRRGWGGGVSSAGFEFRRFTH